MDETGAPEIYIKRDVVPIKTRPLENNPASHPPFKPQDPIASGSITELRHAAKKPFLSWLRSKKEEPSQNKKHFAQLTRHHGRALVDTRIDNQVVWGGEYPADIYGSKDLKGSVMDNIVVTKEEYSPYGYRAQGLKDNVGLERIKTVSKFLRSYGLPTELPVKTSQLEEVVDAGKRVPINEWKSRYLETILQSAKMHRYLGNHGLAEEEEGEYKNIKRYLESTDFYIVERDLQTAVRLRDLTEANSEQVFRGLVEPVMKWLNTATEVTAHGIIPGTIKPERFNFVPKDIQRYFSEWLPTQMGIYLAKLHKFKVVHGFPHAQNWSLVGTLYDLDSVHGEPLGDKPPTEEEYNNDTRVAGGAIYEITDGYGFLSKEFPDLKFRALAAFATSYITERFGTTNDANRLEEIRQKYFTQLEARGGLKLDLPTESWSKTVQSLLSPTK